MALRSLLDIFKADNWSNELVGKISQMLDLSSEMFGYVVSLLVHGEPDDDPQGEVYDRDIEINRLERQIRRRVVGRLCVGSTQVEIPSALIFMNAVKDIERIGDYIKNLYGLRQLMPEQVDRKLYQEWLAGRSKALEDILARTDRAFAESNQQIAREVIRRTRELEIQAEEAIATIARGELKTQDAVTLVLALRFYKRIAAHLSNVATTVVMPVDLLDFYDEPRKAQYESADDEGE
jgi:phosphate transport system protein